MHNFNLMLTQAGEKLENPAWNIYPRPQLKRDSFICLNGEWDFAVASGDKQPDEFTERINVPFAPESILSGICKEFPEDQTLWYKRSFESPSFENISRVLLHFGAVDQKATVFINGSKIGSHAGGYQPFSFDITDYLQPYNTITVAVQDNLNTFQLPYGKQCRKRGGMWYTPVSGIWQTVWLEVVPEQYIKSLKIETGIDFADIIINGAENGVVTLKTPDGDLEFVLENGKAHISLNNPRLWSPEDPYLYYFTVKTENDKIESYFALRTVSIENVDGVARICLNGRPYFFNGLLDQGYFSDGIFTPASPNCYEQDIITAKSLGFNMLRKHIKIEPEQFYYDCDRLGMIVFQDMVNNGSYSFLRDTALPTIGLKRLSDKFLHIDSATRKNFAEHMEQTVKQLYNHPSIVYWTIFNEGWGQFCSTKMYRKLKELDPSRIIDSASGWFAGGETDVDSQHIYFKKIKLKASNKPLVLSEFGGYSYRPEGHVFNLENNYGYGKYETREEFIQALRKLYLYEVLPLIPKGLCAAVYTQLSDVEDETNGLISYDRRFCKLKQEEFADIAQQIISAKL